MCMGVCRTHQFKFMYLHTQVRPTNPLKLRWRQGTLAPNAMKSILGAAVVHGNTAYFSMNCNVYSYTLPEGEWTELPQCENTHFSLTVLDDKLTAIGGQQQQHATNTLLCLNEGFRKWKRLLPPMPTARVMPAAVTTPTHLVVAGGGRTLISSPVSAVEILDLNTHHWYTASSSNSPKALQYPHMTFCGGYLYLSEHNTILSCSMDELLKSCKPPSTNSSDGGSVWTRLTDIPVPYGASLATLRGHVLAIGGREEMLYGSNPTGAIHCYDRSTNSWNEIEQILTPRSDTLVAVLPSNKLLVVGGYKKNNNYYLTEIGTTN